MIPSRSSTPSIASHLKVIIHDRNHNYRNGLLLLLVTFVPFPTMVPAEYFLHSEANVAGAVFAGTLVAVALAFKGLWHRVSKNGRLFAQRVAPTDVDQITMQHVEAL